MKMKKLILILAALMVASLFTGCIVARNVITNSADFEIPYDTSRLIRFEIEMESGAVIAGDLYPLAAPITVRHFVTLAEQGYYNGTEFGVVVAGKYIQCLGAGDEPDYTLRGEFEKNGWKNNLTHYRGTMTLLRDEDDYDSGYSGFQILLENRVYMDRSYAGFGKITSGLLDCDAISNVEREGRVPTEPQIIKEIRILGK